MRWIPGSCCLATPRSISSSGEPGPGASLPRPAVVRSPIYRWAVPRRLRPRAHNPNLGGINAIAIGADPTQRVSAIWELLTQVSIITRTARASGLRSAPACGPQ